MDHHHHLNRHLAHLHQQQQQQHHQAQQLPAHHAQQQQHLQSHHDLAQLQHLQQMTQQAHHHQSSHHVQPQQPQHQPQHQPQVHHHAQHQQQPQQQQQHHQQQQHVQQRQPPQPRIQIPEGMIGVYVKTMKEKKMIPIEPDATIKVFRRKIAGHWCTEKDTLCLIYGGKILEDAKSISDYELKHGTTVRLVIKQVNKNQAEVSADLLTAARGYMHAPQKSDITATPFGLGTMGGLAGTASVGMGSVNFMEMQQRMQHELLSNPESLRIIMENPLVCGLMKRPEEMHELMMANPAMKELIEANPEITQMMHNKELMATIANLAHNPAMLQELVRHEDRIALSSSEAIGPSLGVRLPEEDDDIIFMGSAEEVGGGGGGGGGGGLRGLAQFMRGSWGPGRGRRPPPPVSHVFNTAPIRSLLLQMTESPQIMQNMFSAPYIQAMMTSLTQSPELAEFVASQNPAFKDDEKLMDKIPDLIPHLTAQMQSSAVQGLMTNPKALQALMQVQRGFAALQSEAPDLIDNMGIPFDPKEEKPELGEEEEKADEGKEGEEEEGSPKKNESLKKRDPKEEMPLFLNQVTNLIAAAVPGSNTNALPPSEKYAAQAKQLEFLGFTNSTAVFEALDFGGGDINAAIQRLVPKTKPAFDL